MYQRRPPSVTQNLKRNFRFKQTSLINATNYKYLVQMDILQGPLQNIEQVSLHYGPVRTTRFLDFSAAVIDLGKFQVESPPSKNIYSGSTQLFAEGPPQVLRTYTRYTGLDT